MTPTPLPTNSATYSWEKELGESYRSVKEMQAAGILPPFVQDPVAGEYKFLLPRYYAGLIDWNDPLCPIRLQALPVAEERVNPASFLADPLSDQEFQPAPRITHRYPNRALFHLTSACSMYCRFCFRKTLLNELAPEFFSGDWEPGFRYLEATSGIEEVIFSGGDPFMVKDSALTSVLERLGKTPHLKRVRFHTRVPVTFPSRVTKGLGKALASSSLPVTIVTHFNHPKEVTAESSRAMTLLRESTHALLNQSVLLKNVNDNADTLKALMEAVFGIGLLPYYLHHPDKAKGTAHFYVDEAHGREIYHELKKALPGYLVPRYVRDDISLPYKCSV